MNYKLRNEVSDRKSSFLSYCESKFSAIIRHIEKFNLFEGVDYSVYISKSKSVYITIKDIVIRISNHELKRKHKRNKHGVLYPKYKRHKFDVNIKNPRDFDKCLHWLEINFR